MIQSHFLTSSHMQVHTILHLLAKIWEKIPKNQGNIRPKIGTFRSMFHFNYIYSKFNLERYQVMMVVGTISIQQKLKTH